MTTGDSARKPAVGILYVVATPIGNLRDLSPRACEILASVDLIACEDTRRTGNLLASQGIRRPLISCFEHNEERRIDELIARMAQGHKIALATDAGTPAISDPGYRLVKAALQAGYPVRSVPGPSALVAALSIAGLPTDRFVFEGFLPARAAARGARLKDLASERRTMVFFEAARRLDETLAEMAQHFGQNREVAVVREISKMFEETVRGPLGELAPRFAADPARGEITIVVAGNPDESIAQAGAELTVQELVEAGMELRAASRFIAKRSGQTSREVYQQALSRRREREE